MNGSHNLSDIELVEASRRSREGKDAVSEIISRYMKMVLKRANAFSGNSSDLEDLTQEGLLALIGAVESFDPEKGVAFSAYANVCVTNRIRSAAERLSRHNESGFDDCDLPDERHSPEDICLERESDSRMIKKIESVLAPMEIKVFELYFDGVSYREISERLGISEKSVDNAVFRIRKKLKALLEG